MQAPGRANDVSFDINASPLTTESPRYMVPANSLLSSALNTQSGDQNLGGAAREAVTHLEKLK